MTDVSTPLPPEPDGLNCEIAADVCEDIVRELKTLWAGTEVDRERRRLERQIRLYERERKRNWTYASPSAYQRTRLYHTIFAAGLCDGTAVQDSGVKRPYRYGRQQAQQVSPE